MLQPIRLWSARHGEQSEHGEFLERVGMQNTLMIHVESWDGRVLGCRDFHPAMAKATPNIDALAASGTLFANAYCTNPI